MVGAWQQVSRHGAGAELRDSSDPQLGGREGEGESVGIQNIKAHPQWPSDTHSSSSKARLLNPS